jgi:hypothetical protein
MITAKFKVEKFDGYNSFILWRIKMRALLCQQGLAKILDDEARSTLSKEEIAKLEEKTHNAILSSLLDRIMREIFRLLVCSFGVLNMCLCILWHWVVLPLS